MRRIIYSKRVPLLQAFLWILLSVVVVSGSASIAWGYFYYQKQQKAKDDQYNIYGVVQSTSSKELLSSVYLAELMGLSTNFPTNLYNFKAEIAKKNLLESPLIDQALVKKGKPGIVYVEYLPRVPVAYLADYKDVAIDKEGFIFPFSLFFTPKRLPKIFLGVSSVVEWSSSLYGKSFDLAVQVINFFEKDEYFKFCNLNQVDVSKSFSENLGERDLAVTLEDRVLVEGEHLKVLRFLRLSKENFRVELQNFKNLRDHFIKSSSIESQKKDLVIDLRISQLAFIQHVN